MSAVDEGGCGCPRRTRPASSSRPEGIDRAALEQALADEHLTPLPWAADELGPDVVVRSLAGNWVCETGGSHRETPEADARLIAAAVSALPGLLADLAAAERERDQARAALEAAVGVPPAGSPTDSTTEPAGWNPPLNVLIELTRRWDTRADEIGDDGTHVGDGLRACAVELRGIVEAAERLDSAEPAGSPTPDGKTRIERGVEQDDGAGTPPEATP